MSAGPVALVVLDGFGLAPPGPGNAVELAHTPTFDRLAAEYPCTRLDASGNAVGLPEGQMGNSEVGHLNLGAGRVVRQDLVRIDEDIRGGGFFANPVLRDACARGREAALHLMGLVSDGGVHSHLRHLEALLELARRERVERVFVHAFTDGRDTSPTAGAGYLEGLPGVATVCGRYYAMDRDRRWDRTQRAYDAIVHGRGRRAGSAAEAVRSSYEEGVTDEFVEPTVIGDPRRGRVRGEDAVVFFNFRPDRARQLTRALIEPAFVEFARGPRPPLPLLVQMTRYEEDFDAPVAFAPESVSEALPDVLAEHGVGQLHVAETEKYAHVTYFFGGGREARHDGERWLLVPSPQEVPTYDRKPAMSAAAAADRFCAEIGDGFGFALINFANPDMVGHTGVIPAVVEAVETVDTCLARVVESVERLGGVSLVTADHGNAEELLTAEGEPQTAHTTNQVPFIVTRRGLRLRDGGSLADVAPTVLHLLGIDPPAAMRGRSLIEP